MLDRALLEMVEDLVTGNFFLAADRRRVFEIGHVEIADPEKPDLSIALEALESAQGMLERMLPGPVEQVEIDPIRFQSLQAALAGLDRALAGCVLRQHLGGEKNLLAPAGDRFADDLLDRTSAVHLGGVNVAHPRIQPTPQSGDRYLAVGALQLPRPLTDDRNLDPGPSKSMHLHPHLQAA